MQKRLQKTLVKYLIILAIAVAYLIFVLCTGLGIPCIFYEITGFKCPGCGVSRMLVSLVRFDLASAFLHNPFLFITGPFLIAYLVCSEWKYVKHGNRSLGKWEIFIWIELILALLYGVLRNVFPI
jgi:hypothetical protein